MGHELKVDMKSGEATDSAAETNAEPNSGLGSPHGTVSSELGCGGIELDTHSGEMRRGNASAEFYGDTDIKTDGSETIRVTTPGGSVVSSLVDAKPGDRIRIGSYPETSVANARRLGLLREAKAEQERAESEGRRGPLDAPEPKAPEGVTRFTSQSDEIALQVIQTVPAREQQGLVQGMVDAFEDGSVDAGLIEAAADAAGIPAKSLSAAVAKTHAAFTAQVADYAARQGVDPEAFATYLTERRTDGELRRAVVGLTFGRSLQGFDGLLASYRSQKKQIKE